MLILVQSATLNDDFLKMCYDSLVWMGFFSCVMRVYNMRVICFR